MLYSHRFKIEVGFKQALHVLGSYAYHFWMLDMTSIRARSGDSVPAYERPISTSEQVRRKTERVPSTRATRLRQLRDCCNISH